MGSKRRLLKVILPMFPRNIDTFYDLFAGGLVVSLNVKAKHYVANDIYTPLIKMFNDLGNLNKVQLDSLFIWIHPIGLLQLPIMMVSVILLGMK